jgi:hypothetical protein
MVRRAAFELAQKRNYDAATNDCVVVSDREALR